VLQCPLVLCTEACQAIGALCFVECSEVITIDVIGHIIVKHKKQRFRPTRLHRPLGTPELVIVACYQLPPNPPFAKKPKKDQSWTDYFVFEQLLQLWV
jgi:hypothetical protein